MKVKYLVSFVNDNLLFHTDWQKESLLANDKTLVQGESGLVCLHGAALQPISLVLNAFHTAITGCSSDRVPGVSPTSKEQGVTHLLLVMFDLQEAGQVLTFFQSLPLK